MNRKDTTKFLTELLIRDKLSDRKYFAKEVTLDYGTDHSKRVDIMQYIPNGVTCTSDIEKGIFVCYEIKSCKKDLYSGNGLRFYGEKNYIVTTMQCWKDIQDDYRNGELGRYLKEHYPESSYYYGIMVAIPDSVDMKDPDMVYAEFENPTKISDDVGHWKLYTVVPCREDSRSRSTVELLFCMLRAKHSYSNTNSG